MEDRIARLERANRRLMAAVAGIGAALAILVGAGAARREPGEIRAGRFVLVRPDGGEAAAWSVRRDGKSVSLDMNAGEKGGIILMTTGADGSTHLEASSVNLRGRVEVDVDKDGPSVSITRDDKAVFRAP